MTAVSLSSGQESERCECAVHANAPHGQEPAERVFGCAGWFPTGPVRTSIRWREPGLPRQYCRAAEASGGSGSARCQSVSVETADRGVRSTSTLISISTPAGRSRRWSESMVFGRVLDDVDEPLVDPHLEVLAGVLVLVRRPDHREAVLLGGQRDRALDGGAGAHDGLDDLLGRLIDDLVVVGLQPDSGAGARCHVSSHSSLTGGDSPPRIRLDQLSKEHRPGLGSDVATLPAGPCRRQSRPSRSLAATGWTPHRPRCHPLDDAGFGSVEGPGPGRHEADRVQGRPRPVSLRLGRHPRPDHRSGPAVHDDHPGARATRWCRPRAT